jgi:hypothetical protein
MKNLLLLTVGLVALGAEAQSDFDFLTTPRSNDRSGFDFPAGSPEPKDVVISQRVVRLPVEISNTNVKLSAADYSAPVVKVLIPALADVTLLDHRNTNEGAPCMATYGTRVPNDVIQNNPGSLQVQFQISLIKNLYVDTNNSCVVSMTEHIEGTIRGFKFVHDRYVSLGERHLDDCR